MTVQARPFVAVALYMCAILALIFAFIFFMRMDEEVQNIERFKTHGHVSRAVVMSKLADRIERTERSGLRSSNSATRTTSSPINVLTIRFEPRSTVTFKDYVNGVEDGTLPKAPPVTGNTMSDGQYAGVMLVSDHLFAAIAVGDILTVVNTPFNRSAPRLVSEVRGFDPTSTYAWIMASLLLSLLFAGVAMRISKAKTTSSGSTPVGGSIENPNRALK